MFRDGLYGDAIGRDEVGRLRADARELADTVQTEVLHRWDLVDSDNIGALSDLDRFRDEFLALFGFGFDGVDYDADVDPMDGT